MYSLVFLMNQSFLLKMVIGFSILSACGSSGEKKVASLERPGQTQLTDTRHVKQRNGRENRKRVEYYNSLQYKGNYKHF
jgi:hypothetical protein